MSIPPVTPLAYEGASQPTPYYVSISQLGPTSDDYKFSVPTIWVNRNVSSSSPYTYPNAYILLSKPGNVANWVPFAGAYGSVLDFTVPAGTSPVYPSDGSIALTAGAGMTITGGANTITFSASSSGFSWNTTTSSTQSVTAQNVYVVNYASGVTFSLPSSASVGDTFGIVGYSGDWTISLTTGETIVVGSAGTASVSVASTNESNVVFCSCIVATTNSATIWKVTQMLGNLSFS